MSHLTRLLLGFGSAVLASLLLGTPVVAQVTTADITGRVLDQNGAAVASATITARNIGTGQRTVQSDQNGNYTLSELPPGTYDISVEAPNFSKAVIKARELNVGTTATLNFDLKPGQITEIVNVTADALTIETTRSDLGGVVTPVQVEICRCSIEPSRRSQ